MAAVFGAVFDHTAIKQRIAASESKLRAAAQHDRQRSAQLLQVLDGVEKTLAHNQQHIRRLEEKLGRTLEEFQQLRNLLHDMQIGPSRMLRRCFSPKSYAARADLIVRLDAIISMMTRDGEDGDSAHERDTALARKRPGKGLVFFILMGSLPAKALVAILGFVGSLIAEALVARKVNSSMPHHLVKRSKTRRWAGGAYGRSI